MPKDYHDVNRLNSTTIHHSVGIHLKGFTIAMDIQCKESDADLVKRLVKYVKKTLADTGKLKGDDDAD